MVGGEPYIFNAFANYSRYNTGKDRASFLHGIVRTAAGLLNLIAFLIGTW